MYTIKETVNFKHRPIVECWPMRYGGVEIEVIPIENEAVEFVNESQQYGSTSSNEKLWFPALLVGSISFSKIG